MSAWVCVWAQPWGLRECVCACGCVRVYCKRTRVRVGVCGRVHLCVLTLYNIIAVYTQLYVCVSVCLSVRVWARACACVLSLFIQSIYYNVRNMRILSVIRVCQCVCVRVSVRVCVCVVYALCGFVYFIILLYARLCVFFCTCIYIYVCVYPSVLFYAFILLIFCSLDVSAHSTMY